MKTVKAVCTTLIIVVLVTGCGTDKLIHASNHGKVSANQKVRMKAGTLGGLKYISVRYKKDGRKKSQYFILFKRPVLKVKGIGFQIERESYKNGKYLGTAHARGDSIGTELLHKEEYTILLYVSRNLQGYYMGTTHTGEIFNENAVKLLRSWEKK